MCLGGKKILNNDISSLLQKNYDQKHAAIISDGVQEVFADNSIKYTYIFLYLYMFDLLLHSYLKKGGGYHDWIKILSLSHKHRFMDIGYASEVDATDDDNGANIIHKDSKQAIGIEEHTKITLMYKIFIYINLLL